MSVLLCYAVIYTLEALICWLYAGNVLLPKRNHLHELCWLALFYGTLFCLWFLHITWLNLLAFFTLNFLFLFLSYRVSVLTSLVHAAIITVSMFTGEFVVFQCFSHLAYQFYSNLDDLQNMFILALFSKLIYFIILQFLSFAFSRKKSANTFYDCGIILLVVTSLISFCFMVVICLVCEKIVLPDFWGWIILIPVVLIFIWNLLVFWYYHFSKTKNEEFTSLQLQLQKEEVDAQYHRLLLHEDENQKILIHDIRKHLQTILTLNIINENEKITNYINEILTCSELQTATKVSDHPVLNGIMSRYIRQCRDKGISLRTDIREKSISYLSDKDMTALFCNLMDNAMESAEKVHPAFIDLSVVYKEHTELTIITLINSCLKNPYDEKNKKLKTTKKNSAQHGFGMKSMEQIASHYHGVLQTYYEEKSHAFHTIITLKNF